MDETRDTSREKEQLAEGPRPAVTPAAPVPSLGGLSSGKEPWREGAGCGGRVVLWGAALAVALLVALLVAGTAMMRRTVWANFDAARQAIVNALPPGISPAEHLRTRRNLERFRAVLERSDDPYPQMGEFVRRKQALLQDGRLTDEEIETLNLVLERWIEESGVPPLQLGFRISNFEFRISAHSAPGHRCLSNRRWSGWSLNRIAEIVISRNARPTNSKFEIRNSKLLPV